MKILFTLLSFCFFTLFLKAQNFNGQWKGYFTDNSSSFMGLSAEKTDFVLELETTGNSVNGYSYTYFTSGGKRYYTICKLRGTINRSTKEITVTEFERTKYNTPPEIDNCFQTHKLKYSTESEDTEILQGSWIPAPNQQGNCGYGRTTLSKKIVRKNPAITQKISPPVVKNVERFRDMNKPQQKPVTQKPGIKAPNKNVTVTKPPVNRNPTVNNNQKSVATVQPKKDTIIKKENVVVIPPVKKNEPSFSTNLKFEKRINSVLKTIPIKNETFTVNFYDNGEVDGDSISVFFNDKLVLSHKRLSEKPISLTLTVDPDRSVNELVMYAENMGSIPPNTALMIVKDGDNRYEERITSDTEKNGTIRFSYKPKSTP